jgi:menaquinone-dependent protoporphyrinogen oxidase
MKCLIVYCTAHGTTEKAVQLLSKELEGDITALDLRRDKHDVDVSDFDSIIIGGSIHAGNIQRKVKLFIRNNLDVLLTKKIGLFLCCMYDGVTATDQFDHAFPTGLRKVAVVSGLFGGELIISKMNFFEKQIIKKITGVTANTSNLDRSSINEFAAAFKKVVV